MRVSSILLDAAMPPNALVIASLVLLVGKRGAYKGLCGQFSRQA
nr:hypothetical protein [uncultured Cohaesibacter sp.]